MPSTHSLPSLRGRWSWLASTLALLCALLAAACGGKSGGGSGATLTALAITPPSSSVALGFTQALTATGTFSDMSTRDLTSEVEWSTSEAPVATVDNDPATRGRVATLAVGTASVTATDPRTGLTASTTITVTPAVLVSIALTPPFASLALGTNQQFTATGRFSDDTTQDLTATVTWTSSNASAATVAGGLATTVATGNTTIAATWGDSGISGSAVLLTTPAALVSLAVTPNAPSVALGSTQQFTATGTFSDNTTQDLTSAVTWSSSNPAVASVGNSAGSFGRASSLGVGNTTITATRAGTTISSSTSFAVTPAVLVSLAVSPSTGTVALGYTRQFTAIGTFSDNTTQDLTTVVTWSSASPAVASISNAIATKGLATSASVGNTAISAVDPTTNVTGNATLTVSAAALTALVVTPASPSIPLGTTQQFTATGTFSDNTTQDVTDQVTWTSAAPATATVSNATGSRGLATSLAAGATAILATHPGTLVMASATLTVNSATLVSIDVTPALPSLAVGYTQQFTATGTYSDNSTQDLTAAVTWSSSNPAAAAISNAGGTEGLADTIAAGVATITATHPGSSVAGSTQFTVTPAVLVSLAVTPPSPSVALGYTQQFTATGTFSDNSTQDLTAVVTWSSANGAVASVSNTPGTQGLVSSLAVGITDITATEPTTSIANGTQFTVDAAVLASIAVTPNNPTIALGTGQQFTATGTFSDNSTLDLTTTVTWTSSNPAVAAIANAVGSEGAANGLGIGAVTIQATDPGTSLVGATQLTVTAAALVSLAVTPAVPSLALGYTQPFTATGTFSDNSTQDVTASVTWSSSNLAVAAISNAVGSEGHATTTGTGTTTITATAPGSAIAGNTVFTVTPAVLVSLAVTPSAPSVALGYTQQFTATGTFSDNSTQDLTTSVTWSSSNLATATISNAGGSEGQAATAATGSTTITATAPGSAIAGSTVFTVTAATLVSIGVTPAASSQALGYTQQFTATGTFSDNSTQDLTASVTWSTSNGAVATVSNASGTAGLATTLAAGALTVTATDPGSSVAGSTSFLVTPAVLVSLAVTPGTPSQALGYTQPFTATGTFSDSSTQDLTASVTWSTANAAVATISNASGSQGLATTIGVGVAQVTATDPATSVSGRTDLTVTPAVLVSIAVTPAASSQALGYTRQFTATGTFSDNSTQNVTASVTWSSSNLAVATISNALGSAGLASTVATGVATITATDPTTSAAGSTSFTVTPAVLVSLAVTPGTPSVALGYPQQFTAMGTFSDSSLQDLTASVTWSTGNPAVATVSNAVGSKGLASTIGAGNTAVTATHAGTSVVGSTTLTVTAAVLVSLAVTPANALVGQGLTQQYTATGTYSDNSTQDLTGSVTWASSSPSTATISNTSGSQGLATGVAVGGATISATHVASGLAASTGLTVGAPIVLRGSSSVNAGSGLSVVVPKATGVVSGDVMIAAITVRPSGATITAPSGWTLIRRSNNATNPANSLALYRRTAGASEPSSYTWTLSTSNAAVGGMVAFQGVNSSTVVDVESGQSTASALTHATPSVTTTTANTMLVAAFDMTSSASWTPPTGMTEAVDLASATVGSSSGICLEIAWQLQAAAGATGIRTATASNNAGTGNACIVALRD